MNPQRLIRQNIQALKPYRSARHDAHSGILLDANENSFGSVLSIDGIDLNRYPDPFQNQLRARLAELNGVQTENVFVGVGSDEVIDLLIRVFCEPTRDAILVVEPTYGMYRVAAGINDVRVESSLLMDDFQIDMMDAQQQLKPDIKIIFCCSPNNPTGNSLRTEDISTLCVDTERIVVVDEAYVDFAQTGSLCALTRTFSNLVILRTLSKAWGLAGIRLGYAVADPVIVSFLMKIKSPYNVNALTSQYALRALQELPAMRRTVRAIIQEREQLTFRLAEATVVEKIYPSSANFLLVRFADARMVYRTLAQRGIVVRDRTSEPKLENCLRITVGTPEQNDLLLKVLKEIAP